MVIEDRAENDDIIIDNVESEKVSLFKKWEERDKKFQSLPFKSNSL